MKPEYQLLIRKWSWVTFPIVVGIVILYSSSFVLSGSFWQSLQGKQSDVDTNAALAARLRAKLTRLDVTTLAAESESLNFLLSIQPAAKPVSALVANLNQSGAAVGAVLESFRGTAGEIEATESAKPNTPDQPLSLTATYVVTNLAQLRSILADLEKRLPLVRILEVRFQTDRADVVVEGFWSPLVKLAADVDQPLPDNAAAITKLRQEMSTYLSLPTAAPDQGLPSSVSPF